MLLSVKPDENRQKMVFEAIQTKQSLRGGFIAPSGTPDYASATAEEREYCFIGRTSDNKVYDGSTYVEGYYII